MQLIIIKTDKKTKSRRDVLIWLEKNFGERNKRYWLDDEEIDDDDWGPKRLGVWFEYDKDASLFSLRWS